MQSTNTKEQEDIIEDITEQLLANEEVEQDTTEETAEESAVTESGLSNTITDILLGEKASKTEEEEDEESDDEEESEDEEDEDLEESEESEEEEDEDEDLEESEEEEPENKSVELQAAYQKLKAMKKNDLAAACENTTASDSLRPNATKLEILNAMYKEMKKMSSSNLTAAIDQLDKFQDDKQKATFKGESSEITSALNTLIENDASLSEDFKSQASTLFEAAIAKKVIEVQEDLEVQYHEDLKEEVDGVRDTLVEKIDNYLSYVVETWIEDNQVEVISSLRSDIAENFITSLKDLFVENYIDIPEEKRDIVEELTDEVHSVQGQLADTEVELNVMKNQVENYERNEVIAESSHDLSETESHKFRTILEDIEFNSKESFASKVKVIKSSLFNLKEEVKQVAEITEDVHGETEIIVEGEGNPMDRLPNHMKAYVKALAKK
jgi:hypothetical protein